MRERFIRGKIADFEQLFEAVPKGAIGQVDKLLSRGVSPNCRDNKRRTPLIVASEEGSAAIVGVLIRHKADINAVDAEGDTALIKAAFGGHLTVVKMLSENGADLGIRNNDGSTALETAQVMEHEDVAAFLSSQSAGSTIPIKEEIPTDPDGDGPTTDGPAGASVPVAAVMAPAPELRSYVQELDLESIPGLKSAPYFKLQKESESESEQEANKAAEEQTDSNGENAESSAGYSTEDEGQESYANATKEKPTVSQMVATVKTFLVTYVIMGLEAIGAYLLENVFDGNYKKALSKDPYKGTSLNDLAEHPDMPLSRQRLGECIRVAGVTQELKALDSHLDSLPYYQKLEISRLKSPEARVRLAQEAHTNTLTVREVRERVRKLTRKAVSADKRMAEAVIKQLGVFSQMSVDEETQEFLKDKDRLKAALTSGETAKLLDHSEKFRGAVGESQEILHRLEKTLLQIVVERRRENEAESEEASPEATD